jgi:putative ABC transport system permease protein
MSSERNYPPRWALRFLRAICPDHLLEEIEGDLVQRFERDAKRWGHKQAASRFIWNTVRFFRPGIILRNKFSISFANTIMISNYFTVATRNIRKRKLYSFINAFGLSIGIAFCILIFLFIQDEKSFNQFHANKELIYRMHGLEYNDQASDPENQYKKLTAMQLALAPVMKAELPEVQHATHFCGNSGVLQYGDKIFKESVTYVDADFFTMFSFPLHAGSPEKLFLDKDEIVLTEKLALKYFGDQDPVGELMMLGDRTLKVTGVIGSPPANSSLDFDALVPIQGWRSYSQHNLDSWLNMGFPTFVQLHPHTDLVNLETKLDKLTEKYMAGILQRWTEERKIPKGHKPYAIGFTNLTAIHFEKQIGDSDPKYSWILGGIAVLILLIACINYISLALTTSARRRMEVGVRKAAGARKGQLVYQFGVESIILALISMIIGIGLAVLFLPAFNAFTGKGIELHPADLPSLIAASLGITVTVGLLAGSYPAFFLSGFRAAEVLKGAFTARLQAGFVKPLVVLQFAFSAFLIISSVIMYRQMKYISTKDLGYDQHQLVVIPTNAGRGRDTLQIPERFRQQALKNLSVLSVTATDYPFAGGDMMIFSIRNTDDDKHVYGYVVDHHFIKTMGITLRQGRDFDPNNSADETNTIIVNETLAREMNWNDPLQERLIYSNGQDGTGSRIIGVAKDFHFLSLSQQIEPMFLTIDRNYGRLDHMLVKISPVNIPGTIEHLQKTFTSVAPGKPFEYSFMDENVSRQYASHERWMSIMGLSTGFAILISCLGLFGLAGVNAVNRTKEIGIRKVMGAELSNIFVLLNKQFVWLSIVAFVIAAPLSWYAMNQWLSRFQFRIEIRWELFAVSMIAGLGVALLAVSYHSIKAALVNPADTLKYE